MKKPSRKLHRVVGLSISIGAAIILGGCAITGDDKAAAGYQHLGMRVPGSSYNTAPAQHDRPGQQTSSPYTDQPTYSGSSFESGNAAYRRGDIDVAEQHYRAVIAKEPRHQRAHFNIAMLYLHRAYEGLQRYLELEPDADRRRAAQWFVDQLERISPEEKSI